MYILCNAVLLVIFVLGCRTQGTFSCVTCLVFRIFIFPLDSITLSPNDIPPCVGDTIEMVCTLVPPTSETFASSIAFVSINGSIDFRLSELNSNSVIEGIDLNRYSANIDGLNPSSTLSTIRLIINSYLPLDSYTTFRCAAILINGSDYDSTVSGSPKIQGYFTFSFSTNLFILFLFSTSMPVSLIIIFLNFRCVWKPFLTGSRNVVSIVYGLTVTEYVSKSGTILLSSHCDLTFFSFLVPPSPPVSLTAVFNSPTCSGTVQLAWTPGASDRDIEMYFLSSEWSYDS